jgi:hypothetical protein
MRARWKLWALIGLAIVALSYPLAWFMVRKSDAFAFAESYVRDNPRVIETLGPVRSVGLSPFGYAVRYVGAQGDASFELSVEGQKNSGTVFIELQKRGVWEVKFARLVQGDQQVTQLTQSAK